MKEYVKVSKWDTLKEYICSRTSRPISHPEFIGYFVLVIIVIGGFGVWYDLFSGDEALNVSRTLNGYSLAVIAAGSIELIFSDEKVLNKTLTIISITILVIYLSMFFILTKDNLATIVVSIVFTLFALYIWWIANADNTKLTENYFVENSNESRDYSNEVDDIK